MKKNLVADSVEDLPAQVATWIEKGDRTALEKQLSTLGSKETARLLSRLDEYQQKRLLAILDAKLAADVLHRLTDQQLADVIEEAEVKDAAHILDELPSDDQADVLNRLRETDAEAILDEMQPAEAIDARLLMPYPPNSAGGIMATEYVSYRIGQTVDEVRDDLRSRREDYASYEIQYLYVVDDDGKLAGVLRMRDLLLGPPESRLSELIIPDPLHVFAEQPLDDLVSFFEEHGLFGVPVLSRDHKLLGVVSRSAVEEATAEESERQFRLLSGIIRGDEFRSMSIWQRSSRRLAWLSINVVLNLIAASVIALYEETLQAAIALAVFLPMISDMSGCSGNQAIGVSLRELSLGLIRANEVLRVIGKELSLGLLNGFALGAVLCAIAAVWKGNALLGIVVGTTLMVNTLISVVVGGLMPLLARRLKLDPALISSPALTTVTDVCGFFLALSLASTVLPYLSN